MNKTCPICAGSGKSWQEVKVYVPPGYTTAEVYCVVVHRHELRECLSCNGHGWVVVPDPVPGPVAQR